MNTWTRILAACALATTTQAEELNFFSASKAGPDAWSWDGARVKQKGAVLHITESNSERDYGAVYLSDRFPYFPDGIVKIDVSQIYAGAYTLQILGFQGGAHTFTAEPIKDSTTLNIQTVALADLKIPANLQTLLFKVWVSGAEGASVDLRELLYSKIADMDTPLLMDHFREVSHWSPDPSVSFAVEAAGGRIALKPGQGYGSVAGAKRVAFKSAAELVARVPVVSNGLISIQAEAFNAAGEFLGPVDLVKDVGAGYHGARFDQVSWPAGTAEIGIKLWLSGNEGASAVFDQMLVYSPN